MRHADENFVNLRNINSLSLWVITLIFSQILLGAIINDVMSGRMMEYKKPRACMKMRVLLMHAG